MILMNISEWVIEAFIISLCILAVSVALFFIMLLVSVVINIIERKIYG